MKLNKFNITNFLRKNFSFDSGVNLNDEVEVLYRRNVVIKNIIFVSNIIYSIILFVISIGSFGQGVNWLWSVLPLPITFVLNMTLKKIINNDRNELLRQQIGMYICAFYMFISSLLVYLKLTTTESTANYAEAGYLLFYYSLIVISFYQNTKMLKNIYIWVAALFVVIHFTMTHNFYSKTVGYSFWQFVTEVVPNDPDISAWLRDILFRSLVLALFMIAIYIITSVSEKIAEERIKELTKRTDIQEEYIDVLSDLYDVLLETRIAYDENENQIPLLKKMSIRLATIAGLSPDECQEVADYASYNQDHQMVLDFDHLNSNEEKFEQLRIQSTIGKMVARRMQLSQKCENIVRAHLGGWANQDFKSKMLNIQNNKESQIILLCDLYISLRSPKSYKRPYSHLNSMEKILNEFKIYFNRDILTYFERFNNEFLMMYDNYEL